MFDNLLALIIYKAKSFLQLNPYAPIMFLHRTKTGEAWQIVVSRIPPVESKAA